MVADEHRKTDNRESEVRDKFNVNYRAEAEFFLQKLLLHSADFFSNLLTRLDRRVTGSLTAKYCPQILIRSMLVVLNNFIRKRIITKSRDERSDYIIGQAPKP